MTDTNLEWIERVKLLCKNFKCELKGLKDEIKYPEPIMQNLQKDNFEIVFNLDHLD